MIPNAMLKADASVLPCKKVDRLMLGHFDVCGGSQSVGTADG